MIRQATIADAKKIQELMKAIEGFWDDTWRDDVIERGIIAARGLAYVWDDDGSIEGFICAHDIGFRGYLSELVVSPESQGKGIGKALLTKIEHKLKKRGCNVLIADVWHDAEGFYTKNGWSTPNVVLLRKNLEKILD